MGITAEVEFQTVGWNPLGVQDSRVHLDGFETIYDYDKDIMSVLEFYDQKYTVIKRVYVVADSELKVTAQRRIRLEEFNELYPY